MNDRLQIHEIDISLPNQNNMTDGLLVDLCEQLKHKFEEVEKLEKELKKRNKTLIRHILKTYGLIKAMDKMATETVDIPFEIQAIMDILNDSLEDFLEGYIF
tara:strand:+ start:755 stop:1060 length:306 start_codon:yes stop_codon:yes gene_type:complete